MFIPNHGVSVAEIIMPGDLWQQLANVRAFLGCEFAQEREWTHDQSLDWHLLENPQHAGIQRLTRDLNRLYQATPALYQQDFVPEGLSGSSTVMPSARY